MKQQGKPEKSNTAALAAQLRAAKGSVKVAGILLVLLPAVIAYLTTAWFANNREVEGSGASVTMAAPGTALYIEAGNVQGSTKQYTTAVPNLTLGGSLYPISTADCEKWWYVDGWTLGKASAYEQANVVDSLVTDDKGQSVTGTEKGTYTVGTGENASTYTAYNLLTYTLYTGGGGLNVYLAPGNALTVTGNGEDSKKLIEALRVGVMVNDDLKFIYAPVPELGQGNSQNTTENAYYAVTDQDRTDAAAVLQTVYDTANAETNISKWQAVKNDEPNENSEANTITGYTAGEKPLGTANEMGIVVRLYVWLEGTDAQAMLSQSDNASGVSLSVSFVGVETA